MNELYVERHADSGIWTRLDLGDDFPAMVFQINNLGELKDINASYSQSITLPKSKTNCEALDYLDVFEARSGAPYKILPCELYADDFRITPSGFKLVVKSVERTGFKCQIVSHVAGLLTTLGELTMSDLGLDPIPYTIEEIQASVNGERDYVFALANTHDDGGGPYLQGFTDRGASPETTQSEGATAEDNRRGSGYGLIMANTFWPYFNLRRLVERILEAQGYTLSETRPLGHKDIYISLSDMKPTEGSFDALAAWTSATVDIPRAADFDEVIYMLGRAGVDNCNYRELDLTTLYDTVELSNGLRTRTEGVCYTATDCVNVKVRFELGPGVLGYDTTRIKHRVRKYGLTQSEDEPKSYLTAYKEDDGTPILGLWDYESLQLSEIDLAPTSTADLVWESEAISLSPGQKMYIESNVLAGHLEANLFTVKAFIIFDPDENKVPAGGTIDPGANFDFKNQLEAVKLYMQLFGYNLTVDAESKTVRLYPFENILAKARTGDAVDWTAKIDEAHDQTVTFTLDGYAQRNDVQYKSNDELKFQDVDSLRVDDKNLAAERVQLDLPVLSSRNADLRIPATGRWGYRQPALVRPHYTAEKFEWLAYIKTREMTLDDGSVATVSGWPQMYVDQSLENAAPFWTYKAAGMHIAEMVPIQTGTEGVRVGYLPYLMQPAIYALRTVDNAQWATYVPVSFFTRDFYTELQSGVLDGVRVLTAYFNLTPEDVQNLDLFSPVYIGKFGQYFYIQKIENYVPGELTKTTLVCLNVTDKVRYGIRVYGRVMSAMAEGSADTLPVQGAAVAVSINGAEAGAATADANGDYAVTINMLEAEYNAISRISVRARASGYDDGATLVENLPSYSDAIAHGVSADITMESVGTGGVNDFRISISQITTNYNANDFEVQVTCPNATWQAQSLAPDWITPVDYQSQGFSSVNIRQNTGDADRTGSVAFMWTNEQGQSFTLYLTITQLTAAETQRDIVFSGVVTDSATGEPVPSCSVDVRYYKPGESMSDSEQMAYVTTDAEGRYSATIPMRESSWNLYGFGIRIAAYMTAGYEVAYIDLDPKPSYADAAANGVTINVVAVAVS